MQKIHFTSPAGSVSSGSAAANPPAPDVNIALDIETLSRRPTAAIISIAARVFSFTKEAPVVLDNIRAEQGYILINASTCAMEGLHFDMDTIRWWQRRSEEARAPHEQMVSEAVPIAKALDDFYKWCSTIRKAAGGQLLFWMQGTDFDAAILRNAYAEILGYDTPWKHTELRDSRTFIHTTIGLLRPDVADPYSIIPKNPNWHPHDALSDVEQLIWNVRHVQQLFLSSTIHAHAVSLKAP